MEYSLIVLIILVVFWIICGIIDYGIFFAYFQREYPRISKERYNGDRLNAVFAFFMGPIGLFA